MRKAKEEQLMRAICTIRYLINFIEYNVSLTFIYKDRDLSYIWDQDDYERMCCDFSDILRTIGMYYDNEEYLKDDIFEW